MVAASKPTKLASAVQPTGPMVFEAAKARAGAPRAGSPVAGMTSSTTTALAAKNITRSSAPPWIQTCRMPTTASINPTAMPVKRAQLRRISSPSASEQPSSARNTPDSLNTIPGWTSQRRPSKPQNTPKNSAPKIKPNGI
jgi:hypothetical protein